MLLGVDVGGTFTDAVLAVDGPGQGEASCEFPIEPAYERVVKAVAD